MDTKGGKWQGGGGGGGMNWETGIDMCTLMCIKWITKKNLLYIKKKRNHKINIYQLGIKFGCWNKDGS